MMNRINDSIYRFIQEEILLSIERYKQMEKRFDDAKIFFEIYCI